jgi:guanylate kinase
MAASERAFEEGDPRDDSGLGALVAAYNAPENLPLELIDLPILLLVGPSGVGKDSVKRVLLETDRYYELISHTTRQPRTNDGVPEINGRDYRFVSSDHMAQMARAKQLLQVKRYGDNYYATSVEELFCAVAQGSIAVTDVNVDGAAEFAKLHLNHLSTVFLLPPTFEVWLQRLSRRQSSDHIKQVTHIAQRLGIAISELENAIINADKMAIMVNDNLFSLAREVDAAMVQRVRISSTPGSLAVAKRLLSEIRRYLDEFGS